MDKIDTKILAELDKNPRASFNQLGKASRSSREVSQYRLNQLIKKKIITGFFALVNPSKLGYDIHKLLIKFKGVTKKVEEDLSLFLKKDPSVAWAGTCEGYWDLIITSISKDKKEFTNFYLKLFNKFGKYFKRKELLLPINNPLFNDKYLVEGNQTYREVMDFNTKPEKLDKTDLKILKELSKNSRQMFTKIGESVNLSYWAVSQRYKNLVKKKIIVRLKPRINFEKLGFSYYHLFIELNNEQSRQKIEEYYANHKDCVMLMNHLGSYSIHLEFVLEKDKMRNILFELRENFGKDIESYEPLLITKEHTINLIK